MSNLQQAAWQHKSADASAEDMPDAQSLYADLRQVNRAKDRLELGNSLVWGIIIGYLILAFLKAI